jgi:nitroimidazol reductase NimA-like FMN-containing flavoprotein (pyridoxamine 5'-phosphate oxidase superfamily)
MAKVLTTLDDHEARELLGTARVGFVAYESRRGLDMTPVNFRTSGNTIYIRTVEFGTLAELAPGSEPVAFLVAYLDRLSQTGWTVKVRGKIRAIQADELPEVDPKPWTGYPETVLLGLEIEEVTGRRLH